MNHTITSFFSSIVQRYPGNEAVVHENKSMTYKEIDFAAECLAGRLKKNKIKSCSIIALYLPSSLEAIVSMLGILKAGHAYLSLDINDPTSRIGEIFDNAKPKLIITSSINKSDFGNWDIEILASETLLDPQSQKDDESDLSNNGSKDQKANETSPSSLAYVIYTSGSTGKPKGIPIKHQSVINILDDFQERSRLGNNDKCSLWTTLNFDVSVYEIWSALLSGATLCIPDQQVRSDASKFIQWLRTSDITSTYIPPFMIPALAQNQSKDPIPFKRILTGVEPIPETLLCSIRRDTKGLSLINGYGPAEATVCATLYDVPDTPANPGNAPIGKAIKNLKIYILDESQKPVEDGKKGEIYIAGIQLADGYLNNKLLSEKSFLKNPFPDDLPGFIYKTGDLGTRLETGDIMYGGRKDFQIKLRGFRIEPGEIENVIKEFPGISQTAVVLKENKAQRKILTAYIDSNPDQDQFLDFLKNRLPKYMLPSAIISLKKMPLTSQDKIDKKNLIQRNDLEILNKKLPKTKEEKKIAQIWEEFFNVHPVYRNDDFFLLGGDSISGIKILSRVLKIFSKDIEINTLFENPQLKDFSKFFTDTEDTDLIKSQRIKSPVLKSPVLKETRNGEKSSVPILTDQNLIWIFEQINPGTSVYHIPLVYHITGKLNLDLLKQAIEILKKSHVALKSQFLIQNDITIQKQEENFNEPNPIHFKIDRIKDILSRQEKNSGVASSHAEPENNFNPAGSLKNNDLENKWILEKTKERFNLATGPVFRTDLLITGESSYVLCFTFHHIIFDGWSAGLFVEELNKTYNNLVNGESVELSNPEFTYYDYVSAKMTEDDHNWEAAKPFFTSYLKDLPQNATRSSIDFSGACFPVKIDANTYDMIKHIAMENQTSSFTVLLTLFQILLFAETGQNDQITWIAYAARDKVETEPLIGFLMNTLVVRNKITNDHSLISFLDNVKNTLKIILRYKNIPFQKINQLYQDTSQREKVFTSMFLMQTMDFPPLDLHGTKIKYTHPDMGKSNCDITLELFEDGSELNGWFEYRTNIFSEKRIKQVTKHFNQIINKAIDKPESKINTLLHQNFFPLSPMQHGMLMETLRSPKGAGSYIEQIILLIDQDIDVKRFTNAWKKVIKHHEIMRLGFAWENLDPPMQYIAQLDEINIEISDWSHLSQAKTNEFFEMFLNADRRREFSLSKPPVFRIALLKTKENQYICVWSFHHAIADGRTMASILRNLFLIYHDPNIELTPTGSFKNYIEWLNTKKTDSKAKKFWEKHLNGFTEPLVLPFNLQKKSISDNRRQEYSISITTGVQKTLLSFDKTSALKKICENHSVTMNSLLLGAWAVLLSHYTGKKDIVFGTIRSVTHWNGNEHNDNGLYINTLPIRIIINPEETLSKFMTRIRNEWVKTKDFEHSSLSDIQAWSQVKEGDPLFNILFSYNYQTIDSALEGYKEKISCKQVSLLERTLASIFLKINGIDELLISIKFDKRKFDAATIEQILGHFTLFLESICENTDPRLMDVSIITDLENKETAKRLNTNKTHARPGSCIHNLIGIQASLNKETIAVSDHKINMTYGQLNIYANQIAHYLINLGAIPETKVVLLLEQDANLIAVILGVLKSGSAYVPLDPSYPDERINYIIEDSSPEIIITSKIHEHRLSPKNAAVLLLDDKMAEIEKMDTVDPMTDVTSKNMAYIIYTSGSTGKPKGVIVEHSSLVAFTRSASEIYNIQADDRVLQFASISFDTSAEEIFPTLFSGATLVMKPRGIVHTPSEFSIFCKENNITVLDLPTSYWHMIADEIDTLTMPEHIRLIIIGGDEANSDKVEKWNKHANPDVRLINTYGPTETTVAVTWADLSSTSGSTRGKVSIGAPFPNVSLCILNHFQQPALPGTMGELYIGGTQTARGYLNRKELTGKSFLKLKNTNKDTLFFKTGDSVEMLAGDGILFYGRIDRQIKIRGFRVEPGEIEKTALLHDSISECAIAVSKDPDKNITFAAFIVLKQKQGFSTKAFRVWLLSKLPDYMVPSLIILSESLPYTSSGKIDYNALKIPKSSKVLIEKTDISLFNQPYENDLKTIWETVLNFEVLGPEDNFFDIGGSSLSAIKLVTAIEKKFKISIPVIAVFKFSTIRELATLIKKGNQASISIKGSTHTKGTETSIILIGNSVGSAQAYKKADLKGHPFYHAPIFIHFYSMENDKTRSLDIWQLARKCIEDISHFSPTGPYIIIGSCLNSTVAHEVAWQLVGMNKKVELLVIIDQYWHATTAEKQIRSLSSFVKKQMNEINEFGVKHVFKKIISRINSKIRTYYTSLDSIKESIYKAMGKPVPDAIQFRSMENVFKEAYEANAYMPASYYGRVLLFHSKNWKEELSPKLATYYKGATKEIDVKTSHSEWFKPEQIEMILNEINENLSN